LFYSSSRYDSIFDWVFSLSGIICILILVGIIWLIVRMYDNAKQKNTEVYLPSNTKYESEYGSDNSFWDDIKQEQGQEKYPQREEEPVPPNAIPPTSQVVPNMAVVSEECDYNFNQNGELEKDCTKQIIARDNFVDESALNIAESQNQNSEN
jgi:type II secretory pathway component PulC